MAIAIPAEAARLLDSGTVDADDLEKRAAALAGRSIERDAELRALDLVIRCMDLTTLTGSETPDEVVALCARAVRPDPLDPSIPPVAAVCLYPEHVAVAARELRGTGVLVASVAGAFPSGAGPLTTRLSEIERAVADGADEVDIVLNRGTFLAGRYPEAFEELVEAKRVAGPAQLKVILEIGELGSYDNVRRASMLAMAAGAEFIKTSTGKIGTGATLPGALCMMETARDFHRETGRAAGVKVAGGIRQARQAIQYATLFEETLGPEPLGPERFRIGASSLLDDVLRRVSAKRAGDGR